VLKLLEMPTLMEFALLSCKIFFFLQGEDVLVMAGRPVPLHVAVLLIPLCMYLSLPNPTYRDALLSTLLNPTHTTIYACY